MSDSFVDFYVFALDQVWGREYQASPRIKDSFAETLAGGYPGYSAEAQKFISVMPRYWAAVQVTWPTLSEADQDQFKAQWVPLVGNPPSDNTDSGPRVADSNPGDTGDNFALTDSGSATASTSGQSSETFDSYMESYKEHLFVNQLVGGSRRPGRRHPGYDHGARRPVAPDAATSAGWHALSDPRTGASVRTPATD
jgi:hypothetical protein